MGLGRLFGRGKDEDEGLGIPGLGDTAPTPPATSAEVHVTSRTVDVSNNPEAVDAVMDMLKAQGIDLGSLPDGATIQMGQPMDPADAERFKQNMLGMLGSMGIDASAMTPPPISITPPAGDADVDDVVASLERLVKLRDAGALTPEEFEAQKARILGGG